MSTVGVDPTDYRNHLEAIKVRVISQAFSLLPPPFRLRDDPHMWVRGKREVRIMQGLAKLETVITIAAASAGLFIFLNGLMVSEPLRALAGLGVYLAVWAYGLMRASYTPDPNPH